MFRSCKSNQLRTEKRIQKHNKNQIEVRVEEKDEWTTTNIMCGERWAVCAVYQCEMRHMVYPLQHCAQWTVSIPNKNSSNQQPDKQAAIAHGPRPTINAYNECDD